jgi:hypothetical protein
LVHSREIKREDVKDMLVDKSQHHWREGIPHPKKDLILMRFATNGDKKMTKKKQDIKECRNFYDESMDTVSKNPWGDLCKSWGVYDHQEVFNRKLPPEEDMEKPQEIVKVKNKKLAMRLGKRNYKNESEDSNSDSEWKKKSKTPRMRMHADDEESKLKRACPDLSRDSSSDREDYAPLSVEVANSKSIYAHREGHKLSDKFKTRDILSLDRPSIQSRLGFKVKPRKDDSSSDESSADSADHNVMSRVQKMNTKNNTSSSSSVWSRLEGKSDNVEVRNDLRHILKSKRQNNPDDLRKRLGKLKQTNLRIEIDNNYAQS